MLLSMNTYLALLWGIFVLLSTESMSVSIPVTGRINTTTEPNKTTKQLPSISAHVVHKETETQPATQQPTHKPAEASATANTVSPPTPTIETEEATVAESSNDITAGLVSMNTAAETTNSSRPRLLDISTAVSTAPTTSQISMNKSTPATTTAPCEASESLPSSTVHPCSSRGVVKHCLITIAALAGLATVFMVTTIVLCTKLSARKYKVKKPSQSTEMICISALLPERTQTYTRQRNPVPNGVLVIHHGGDSDEDGGDNLTLSSFLPENDRYVLYGPVK
uniref:P-selectin glycoprotein ligand 1 n=1 Tax=Dicentrarchus labrax TaxID=13489 RepID=A0A8C4I6S6_DICLA